MPSKQPIDNRDMRIFDFNLNENLSDILNILTQGKESNDHALEEINIHLGDIATSLRKIATLYTNRL